MRKKMTNFIETLSTFDLPSDILFKAAKKIKYFRHRLIQPGSILQKQTIKKSEDLQFKPEN